MDIKKLTRDLVSSSTPKMLRDWVITQMNKIAELEQEKLTLSQKIEHLEAEIRRVKGLPAKPQFSSKDKTTELEENEEDEKGDEDDDNNNDGESGGGNSGNSGKKNPGKGKPRRKKKDLKIDETKRVGVDPNKLDGTFEYKGTRKVIVQDLIFIRNNVQFELEKFYSEEHGKTVEADLPKGYEGGYFGPNLKSYVLSSYYEGDVTIKKIGKILHSIELNISEKQINRIINTRPEKFEKELEEARDEAIKKAGYQQIDDTSASILGVDSAYTLVCCNPYFTKLQTTFSKGRQAAIMALAGRRKNPLYKMNDHAIMLSFLMMKSLKIQKTMETWQSDKVYSEDEVDELLSEGEGFKNLKPPSLRNIKTAMLAGAFYDDEFGEVGEALVSDDAPQFKHIYDIHALCWYHELRHYKELVPSTKEFENKLQEFFTEVKSMYKVFKKYLKTRDEELRKYIFEWFNVYFKTKCGYKPLDDLKKKTWEKMDRLLAPLWADARLPLQNNESERDLRGKVIKRKISLFDKTWKGAKARDLYISLKQTCRKNEVSFYNYLQDRVREAGTVPQLPEIIRASSPQY